MEAYPLKVNDANTPLLQAVLEENVEFCTQTVWAYTDEKTGDIVLRLSCNGSKELLLHHWEDKWYASAIQNINCFSNDDILHLFDDGLIHQVELFKDSSGNLKNVFWRFVEQ